MICYDMIWKTAETVTPECQSHELEEMHGQEGLSATACSSGGGLEGLNKIIGRRGGGKDQGG